MCSTYSNGLMTSYNVCPKVLFSIYGKGSIMFSSGQPESFSWSLKNGALKISNMLRNSKNTFLDTTYAISIHKEKNSFALQIRDVTNNDIFYLSKYFDINK
jgi:hypothetical protein